MGKSNLAMAILAVVLLAGCTMTSTDSPSSTQSTSPSPSPTASKVAQSATPSPTKVYRPATEMGPAEHVPFPVMPQSAKAKSADGASAFAGFYFSLINYAVETNDPEPLKAYSLRKCEICGTALIDPAGRAQITGKWQVGGKHEYKVIDTYKPSKDKATVSVRFKVDAAKFYITPKKVESSNPESRSQVAALTLVYDSGWKVYAINFEKTDQ